MSSGPSARAKRSSRRISLPSSHASQPRVRRRGARRQVPARILDAERPFSVAGIHADAWDRVASGRLPALG
jgi:hypothetical protein